MNYYKVVNGFAIFVKAGMTTIEYIITKNRIK